jgi:glycosyltransferase involved in cell wall biosynthesis
MARRGRAAMAGRLPLRLVAPPLRPDTGYARNVAVAAADGELLVFCDADDEVRPDWLRLMVSALERNPLGYRLTLEPAAVVDERVRTPRWWQLFRVHVRDGLGVVRLYREFRELGMPRSPLRDLIYDRAGIPFWMATGAQYHVARVAGRRVGRLIGSTRRWRTPAARALSRYIRARGSAHVSRPNRRRSRP